MLRHLQYHNHADAIERALHKVLAKGHLRTADLLGGTASTTDFTDGLISSL